MKWTETLTLSIHGSLLKDRFLENSFGQLSLEEINRWQMTNCKKTMIHIALDDVESNGASDWLDKASTRLVG